MHPARQSSRILLFTLAIVAAPGLAGGGWAAPLPSDFVSGMVEGTITGGAGPANTPLMTVPGGKVLVITDLDYDLTWDNGMTGNRVEGAVILIELMTPRWSAIASGFTNPSAGTEGRHMIHKSFSTGIVFTTAAGVIHHPWQNSATGVQVRWRISWSGYLAPSSTTGLLDPGAPRKEVRLGHASPNPLEDGTRIGFTLDRESRITVRIVDAGGRLVRQLFEGRQSVGEHDLTWDARDDAGRAVRAGAYFIELLAADERFARKVVVIN